MKRKPHDRDSDHIEYVDSNLGLLNETEEVAIPPDKRHMDEVDFEADLRQTWQVPRQ